MISLEKKQATTSLPPSCSNYAFNLFCLALFFASMFLLHKFFPLMRLEHLTLFSLSAMAVPLWSYDLFYLKVYNRPSTGLTNQENKPDLKRLSIKLVGLSATFLIILFLYFAIPLFHNPFYKPFFYCLKLLSPAIIIISLLYFWKIDRRQKNPYDEYWHMGCLFTGRFKEVNWLVIKEHARCWFIKGFFTPHLFIFLVRNVEYMVSLDWHAPTFSFLQFYAFALFSLFMIDIVYGILGYIMTFRLIDTHIRSSEPTILGWLACLICYYPFAKYVGVGLLNYEDGFTWNNWFAHIPIFYYFYGSLIILLTGIYALATVALGYRSSNLTFRGIITSGPYRYTKHPAYLCKVLSWWLIAVPFFSFQGPILALKNCFFLGLISLVYYFRAVTEENHLSNYPEYVQYARWINEHGALRLVNKFFPELKYSYEKSRRWNSVVWFKKLPGCTQHITESKEG